MSTIEPTCSSEDTSQITQLNNTSQLRQVIEEVVRHILQQYFPASTVENLLPICNRQIFSFPTSTPSLNQETSWDAWYEKCRDTFNKLIEKDSNINLPADLMLRFIHSLSKVQDKELFLQKLSQENPVATCIAEMCKDNCRELVNLLNNLSLEKFSQLMSRLNSEDILAFLSHRIIQISLSNSRFIEAFTFLSLDSLVIFSSDEAYVYCRNRVSNILKNPFYETPSRLDLNQISFLLTTNVIHYLQDDKIRECILRFFSDIDSELTLFKKIITMQSSQQILHLLRQFYSSTDDDDPISTEKLTFVIQSLRCKLQTDNPTLYSNDDLLSSFLASKVLTNTIYKLLRSYQLNGDKLLMFFLKRYSDQTAFPTLASIAIDFYLSYSCGSKIFKEIAVIRASDGSNQAIRSPWQFPILINHLIENYEYLSHLSPPLLPSELLLTLRELGNLDRSLLYLSKNLSQELHKSRVEKLNNLIDQSKSHPVLLPIFENGHISYAVLYQNTLLFCNRGGGNCRFGESGIYRAIIQHQENLLDLLGYLVLDTNKTKETFEELLQAVCDERRERLISQSDQKVGNCPWTSLKSALHALIFLHFSEENLANNFSLEAAENDAKAKAHECYKNFTRFDRRQLLFSLDQLSLHDSSFQEMRTKLNDYLERHPSDNDPPCFLDSTTRALKELIEACSDDVSSSS